MEDGKMKAGRKFVEEKKLEGFSPYQVAGQLAGLGIFFNEEIEELITPKWAVHWMGRKGAERTFEIVELS